MSKQTEKLFRDFNKFIKENGEALPDNPKDINKLMERFMAQYQPVLPDSITVNNAETADDFLELAQSSVSKKSALKFAKKALELEPDNLDASVMIAELSASTPEKLTEKYKELIEQADKKLASEGYFDDGSIGEFWLITETRPYMRLLEAYASHLAENGQMRLAAAEYKKMLRLCTNDNLGVRYRLMHIYAYLEEEQPALELMKTYPENSTQFLLPLSVLYYKLGDLKESNKYLKKLCTVNEDTGKFFSTALKGDITEFIENMNPYGYRPFTIEEFIIETEENHFLLGSVPSYLIWAGQKTNPKKQKK